MGYDHANQKSKKFTSTNMEDPPLRGSIVINGVEYPTGPFDNPGIDGIALPPSRDRVYFCTLMGLDLWSVDAKTLRDYVADKTDEAAVKKTETLHGEKPGMADGMTFDSEGRLYFGAISNSTLFGTDGNALYSWAASGSASEVGAVLVAQNDLDLHWVDTFAFDNENKKLLFTPNRLDVFFNDNDRYWSEAVNTDENPNIQVVSVSIGATSYLAASPAPAPTTPEPKASANIPMMFVAVLIGLSMLMLLCFGAFVVSPPARSEREQELA